MVLVFLRSITMFSSEKNQNGINSYEVKPSAFKFSCTGFNGLEIDCEILFNSDSEKARINVRAYHALIVAVCNAQDKLVQFLLKNHEYPCPMTVNGKTILSYLYSQEQHEYYEMHKDTQGVYKKIALSFYLSGALLHK